MPAADQVDHPRPGKPAAVAFLACCGEPMAVAYSRPLTSERIRRCRACPRCGRRILTDERLVRVEGTSHAG